MEHKYDIIVIGAGSGGVRAARLLSQSGKKVAILESSGVGGTCVLRGCVPKKLFKSVSAFSYYTKHAMHSGWNVAHGNFSLESFMDKKDAYLDKLSSIYISNLKKAGVDLIKGHGSFIDANSIKCGDDIYKAEKIIIATGSKSKVLGCEGGNLLKDSDDFLSIDYCPAKTIVIGGGYIALELASIAAAMGSSVTVLVRSKLLKEMDQETVNHLKIQLENRGIKFVHNVEFESVEYEDERYILKTNVGEFKADYAMSCIGRFPNVDGLSLENCGVKLDTDNSIAVDNCFMTNVKGIYAIGDVINKVTLTPVAIKEAHFVHNHIIDNAKGTFDYSNIPTAVFCLPEMATIGLSQEEAEKSLGADGIVVYKGSSRPLEYAISDSDVINFAKLIVRKSDNVVIGLTGVGQNMSEIVQGFAVAMKLKATKEDFDSTIALHPSWAEEFVTLK